MAAFDLNIFINMFLLALLLITAVYITFKRNLLVVTVVFSIFSLIMAASYLVLGAPDVAITEAAIGACISSIFFLAALLFVGENEKPSKRIFIPIIAAIVTGGALICATSRLAPLGDPESVTNKHVAPYYINNTEKDTGVPNIVTAVLASYRGYDTLGETFVIFTAGICVLAILGYKKKT